MKTITNTAILCILLVLAIAASGAVSFFAGVGIVFFLLGMAMDFYAAPGEKKKNEQLPGAGQVFTPIRPTAREVPAHLRAPRSVVHIYRPGLVPRRAVTTKSLTDQSRRHSVLSGSRGMTTTGNGRTKAQAQSGNYTEPETFDEVQVRGPRKITPDYQLEIK